MTGQGLAEALPMRSPELRLIALQHQMHVGMGQGLLALDQRFGQRPAYVPEVLQPGPQSGRRSLPQMLEVMGRQTLIEHAPSRPENAG